MITDMQSARDIPENGKKSLGLYIHIPFCRQKCNYCDFCSVAKPSGEFVDAYLKGLLSCIEKWSERARGHVVDTVYIGGGTPTTLTARQLSSVIDSCAKNYSFSDNPEISCECNPATGSREFFRELRGAGINRLSIGVQSANDDELRALGRIHDFRGFVGTYNEARGAGFDNISVDLMYGIPLQTVSSFEKTLDDITALSPEHISAYCLKVEENTPFGKMADRLILPDEDEQFEMYRLCVDKLRAAGYDRYEISNFAKRGRESRHNMRYWLGEDYLGFGAAAHSYFEGERFSFAPNIAAFANGTCDLSEGEKIEGRELMSEFVMLRMRLREGVLFEEFERRFGCAFYEAFPAAKRFEGTGHAICDGASYRFGDEGFFVSSYILSEILDF